MNILRTLVAIISFSTTLNAAVKLQTVIPRGLDKPLYVTTAPGEPGKLYILEQKGRIRVFENGKLSATPFLDIRSKVIYGGEQGLLGLAFHPNYASNHLYYVNYTTPSPRLDTIIAEYKAGSDQERELMRIAQPFSNHNGGHITFGQDGFLYIGMGDGGSAGDPHNNSQNMNSLLGKFLRIDVNAKSGSLQYAIPSDNPFVAGPGRAEIYALGIRNPWRFAFDRVTGALFTGDVGQNRFEEVDIIEKGKNYGWRVMEAAACFLPAQGCDTKGLTFPIFQYDRGQGVSITGGFVYRGQKLPELVGAFIYGDYGSGKIWALHYDQAAKKLIRNDLLLESELPVSSFGETVDGEILVVSHDGPVFQVVRE